MPVRIQSSSLGCLVRVHGWILCLIGLWQQRDIIFIPSFVVKKATLFKKTRYAQSNQLESFTNAYLVTYC